MRKWALDTLAKDPQVAEAVHEFERRERRPIRFGPPPAITPAAAFQVALLYDGQPCLTLGFQQSPPVLQPGDLFRLALKCRAPKGSVEATVLATFLEYSQDWHGRTWEQVLAQLAVPVQAAEKALREGFEVNVGRMKD